MKRLASLLRRTAIAAALSVAAPGVAPALLFAGPAHASGRGSDDDGPDVDDWAVDDSDHDNSGHGGGDDDWDDNWDDISSEDHGSGGDDDVEDQDSSGHGGGDSSDDNSGDNHDAGDNSGRGNSQDAADSISDHDGPTDEVIYSVEYDSQGDEFTPGEIVFVGARRELSAAIGLGFQQLRAQTLSTGGVMARLALPPRTNMAEAMAMARQAAPHALVTPNNIYRSAQSARPTPTQNQAHAAERLRGTMGIIDTGVDASTLPAGAVLSQHAFAGPQTTSREHGAVVTSIAVSRGVRVHVADVFGQSTDGALAASAERIAAAVDWMIANRVAVVNISVEGPNNAILDEMIRRAARRGHIIVAAAGNGGPAARPTFPAAFDGVLAVTAIDETGRPYLRANRGAYIDFAAPGVDVGVEVGGATERVSGTSFAAPVIAAEAAALLHTPSVAAAERAVTRMRQSALDLGAPGRDDIFGWGALRD